VVVLRLALAVWALLRVELSAAQFGLEIGKGESSCNPLHESLATGHSGTLTDGSDKAHPYSGGRDCKTILSTEVSGPIRLKFTRFDTEANIDVLTVYDGPDADTDNIIGA
jgi:hypothetical protein